MLRLLSLVLAAGTALTNSTDETVLGSYTFGENVLGKNKVYRVKGSVRATATNATDTLQIRGRFGDTTLTGEVVFDSGAVDVANDDVVVFEMDLIARDDPGATVDIVARGIGTAPGAAGTAAAKAAHAIVADQDTTGELLFEVTGEWSVANAGNSCQLESLDVYEVAA